MVWLDLGLIPSLSDHWQTLYPLLAYMLIHTCIHTGVYIYIYIYIYTGWSRSNRLINVTQCNLLFLFFHNSTFHSFFSTNVCVCIYIYIYIYKINLLGENGFFFVKRKREPVPQEYKEDKTKHWWIFGKLKEAMGYLFPIQVTEDSFKWMKKEKHIRTIKYYWNKIDPSEGTGA